MNKMLAAGWCAVLLTVLSSCSEQPATVLRPQGLLVGEEAAHVRPHPAPLAPATSPVAPPPRSALTSPFAPTPDPGALSRPAQAELQAAPTPDAGTATAVSDVAPPLPGAQTTTPRDLPAELTALLGQPGSCLDLKAVATAGGRTTISVTVSVMPSGRVIRASANVPNQSGAAVTCLEKKASAGSFRAPVPGAPLDVTATIPIEVVAQP